MKPSDLGFTNYQEYRPCQADVLDWAQQSDRAALLVEAPPGVGKSLIGASWGRAFAGSSGWILTRTLSLMAQYEDTLGLRGIRGADNFTCHAVSKRFGDRLTCSVAKDLCPDADTSYCPYYLQRAEGLASGQPVTSYAYALADSTSRLQQDYLVCDEGHNILDVVTDWLSISIPLDLDPPTELEELIVWAPGAALAHHQTIPDRQVDPYGYQRWVRLDENLTRLSSLHPQENPYVVVPTIHTLSIKPVWPKPNLWRPKNLVMSATLYGAALLAEMFGFVKGNWDYYHAQSPFDPIRRPIYVTPFARLNAKSGQGDYEAMAKGIEWLVSRYPHSKGLLHVSSYKQVERLHREVDGSLPILWHQAGTTRNARTLLFNQFRTAPAPLWLCSPSAREGEDFPHDMARVQAILKIQYPDLGDPIISARKNDGKLGSSYYAAATCANVAQAYGRVMRSADDHGDTYILDSSIFSLLKYSKAYLPHYFLEALRE